MMLYYVLYVFVVLLFGSTIVCDAVTMDNNDNNVHKSNSNVYNRYYLVKSIVDPVK